MDTSSFIIFICYSKPPMNWQCWTSIICRAKAIPLCYWALLLCEICPVSHAVTLGTVIFFDSVPHTFSFCCKNQSSGKSFTSQYIYICNITYIQIFSTNAGNIALYPLCSKMKLRCSGGGQGGGCVSSKSKIHVRDWSLLLLQTWNWLLLFF